MTKSQIHSDLKGKGMKINLLTDCYKSVFSVRPCLHNTPFPSSKKSHLQNEAKCETFVVKMSFIFMSMASHLASL